MSYTGKSVGTKLSERQIRTLRMVAKTENNAEAIRTAARFFVEAHGHTWPDDLTEHGGTRPGAGKPRQNLPAIPPTGRNFARRLLETVQAYLKEKPELHYLWDQEVSEVIEALPWRMEKQIVRLQNKSNAEKQAVIERFQAQAHKVAAAAPSYRQFTREELEAWLPLLQELYTLSQVRV